MMNRKGYGLLCSSTGTPKSSQQNTVYIGHSFNTFIFEFFFFQVGSTKLRCIMTISLDQSNDNIVSHLSHDHEEKIIKMSFFHIFLIFKLCIMLITNNNNI